MIEVKSQNTVKNYLEALNAVYLFFQVCFSLEDAGTRKRELQALIEAQDELKVENLIVLTDDEESMETIRLSRRQVKIHIIPLWKWLIQPDKLSQTEPSAVQR